MSKRLVVVESPAKAKTIKKYLGRNYKVEACFGAVRDLPKSSLGVDVENDFEPKYVNIREENSRKAVKAIKEAAASVDEILLASDPDREGEAIAWHVAEILRAYKKTADKPVRRIVFNAITKNAVQEAVEHPREIHHDLVDAQQARRILDRLVGYKLSPLLAWVINNKRLSAGRVQSPAVRMVVEREREIRGFKPEEYWNIAVGLMTPREEGLTARLHKREGMTVKVGDKGQIKTGDEAQRIVDDLRAGAFGVSNVERKEVRRRPAPPFITSTLQQEASRKLRMTPRAAMAVAQQLYQGISLGKEGLTGLITYMRTDSTRIAPEALNDVRSFIGKTYEKEMLPEKPNFYRSKKDAQDAHEAIRVTSAFRTPEAVKDHLNEDQLKLYTLIWQRFVASQMPPAVFDQTTIEIKNGPYDLRATGTIMKFPGFTKVYEESQDDKTEGDDAIRMLPEVSAGEKLSLDDEAGEMERGIATTQHFTQPPPRFTEASLIRALEENGIGRPSTYAPIVNTILDRNYVQKEKGRLVPTDLGELVNEWLVKHFPEVVNIDFTANLEGDLDHVEEGTRGWRELIRAFYKEFSGDFDAACDHVVREFAGDDPKCPKCGAPVELAESWFGLYLACSRRPECKGTLRLERHKPEPTDEVCSECGKPMVVRSGRFGKFLGCSGYPDCKNVIRIDAQGNKLPDKPKTPPKKTDQECPDCKKGFLVIRTSRQGEEFYGCENYPKCRFTKPMELNLPCPRKGCGGTLERKRAGRRRVVACDNADCDFSVAGRLDLKTPCSECGNSWTVINKPRGKPEVRRCPVPTCGHTEEIETDSEEKEAFAK